MKNIIFITTLFLFLNIYSQDIGFTEINVSQLNSSEINVNLKVITNASEYISSSYNINGNEINLNVCYFTYGIGLIMNLENNIPVSIPSDGNYTLNITIYQSISSSICDYNNIQGTTSLSFVTPVNNIVTLSSPTYMNTNDIYIYPNPTTGIIYIKGLENKNFTIYDQLGRTVKRFYNQKSNFIDISEFEKGIYYIEMEDSDKILFKNRIMKT
jgi:hypothetical protein